MALSISEQIKTIKVHEINCKSILYFNVVLTIIVFRHVTQMSTNQIISITSREVAKLKVLVRKANKQRQLQVEKLEDNFKEAIGKYSNLQKVSITM